MKREYSNPEMIFELFTSQDYIAVCSAIITYTYDGSTVFPPNTHFYKDVGIEGVLDESDFLHAAQTYNYGNENTVEDISILKIYYWAADNEIAKKIHNDLKDGNHDVYDEYVRINQAGQVLGFTNNNGGNQIVAGTVRQNSYKNHS